MGKRGPQPRVATAILAAHYSRGATLRELGERFGLAHQNVAKRLAAAGIPRRRAWHQRRKVLL